MTSRTVIRRDPLKAAAWMDRAACRGLPVSIFFPSSDEDSADGIAVCARCPVRAECLEYASGEKYGIWGGASERERRAHHRRLRRDRAKAAS